MPEPRPHRRSARTVRLPLLDRWTERYGSPPSWSDTTKCTAITAGMVLGGVSFLAVYFALDGWPFFAHDMAPVVRETRVYPPLAILPWVALLAWSRLGDRESDRNALVYATVFYYGFNMGLFAYIVGPFEATAGFALFAGLIAGSILFGARITALGLVFYVFGVASLAFLCHRGYLPLEPLFVASTGGEGLHAPYVLRNSVAMTAFAAIALPILGTLAESWRYRELQLEEAARTDFLTKVYNRAYVMARLDEAFTDASSDYPVSVVMIDVDHFKRVNDTFGHLAGDEVLRQVASSLANTLRRDDVLGRYGGEEFLMVLPGVSHENARQVAERCRAAISELSFSAPQHDSGVSTSAEQPPTFSVTASFGVATCPPARETVDQLLDDADGALYDAKDGGRNSVVSGRASLSEAAASA